MALINLNSTMMRHRNLKTLIPAFHRLTKLQIRMQTTNVAIDNAATSSKWETARPLEAMPTPGVFDTIRAYMPGGKYYKKDLSDIFLLWEKEYGDIVYMPGILGKPPIVITFNPNDFEIIFRNEGIWPERLGAETIDYHRKKHRADFFQGVEGLMTTRGETWGKFRSIVNPVLMQPKNVRLYLQKMSEVNREFVERIKQLRDPKTNELPPEFESTINRWTLESVAIVALDKQLGLLKEADIDPIIQKYFDSITDFITLVGDLDMKPSLWKFISTPKFQRLMKAFDNIVEITSLYINEAIERSESEQKSGVKKNENEMSVLEKLLKIDEKVAKVMAMDMLMAGVDTTSGTFFGIMLSLAKNPEKQEKLREELRRILPEKDSEFTEKSLNDMSYLRACIKESLRMYPLVVGNGRMTQRDIVISGYRVPKGTQILMLTTSINHNENYYPRPNEFLPERWLRTPKDAEGNKCPNALKTSNPFAYLPFGFGPRSCIGRRIAEMELELGIARIIRNFNVAYNYPTERAFKTLMLNVPNIPLKFQVTDVKT